MFNILLTHLEPFLDNLMRNLCIMFTFIVKKIIKVKNKHNLDAKLWIQKTLLVKYFKNNSF